tara:strand:+ start:139 stop:1155 length:1017 start_codon:yes stop_codon:yes gene_type:complete
MLKPSKNNPSVQESEVLDIEKKYMRKLLKIFRSEEFYDHIGEMISKFSDEDLKSYKKSPTDILFQRSMNLYIIDNLRDDILYPYISPISSDSAFVLNDCVLNVDAKTISAVSNTNDMTTLQVSKNQISFENKKIETPSGSFNYYTKLAHIYEKKPVLSFFLHFHYQHNKKGDFRNLKFFDYRENKKQHYKKFGVFGLICVPNRIISRFFENDLLTGFKNYMDVTQADIKAKHLFPKVTLKNEPKIDYREIKNVDDAKQHLISSGVDTRLFSNVDEELSDRNGYYFICKRTETMYRWVKRKAANTFGPQEPTGTPRIDFSSLKKRFTSNDCVWSGVWHW